MNPLVTIMVATYNQPDYIRQCVESCINQDYDNLEIVIGDDSTNDDNYEVLKPILDNKKVKYFRNKTNIGRVKNYKNLLFDHAAGEWTVMMDGDDYYSDHSYISKVISIIQRNPAVVMVGAGHKIFYERTNTEVDYKIIEQDKIFPGRDVLIKNLQIPQHTTEVYNRQLACKLNFYNHASNASDAEGLYRLFLNGDVAFLNCIPVVWRIHDENTTFTRNINQQLKELNWIESVYNYSLNYLNKSEADKWRHKQYFGTSHHMLELAFKSGDFLLVLKVAIYFRKYWGNRSFFRVFYRFAKQRSNKSFTASFFYKCFNLLKRGKGLFKTKKVI